MLLKKLSIVTPVFNDWESFERLIQDLSDLSKKFDLKINLIAVNDGSTTELIKNKINTLNLVEIKVLQLVSNLGHQRAIALGLVEAYSYEDSQGVVVLDCDGEDKVDDILQLINNDSSSIVVAKRSSRSEGIKFTLLYITLQYLIILTSYYYKFILILHNE